MKVDLHTFLSAQNGITLVCIPETQVEMALIKGFGLHGTVKCEDGQLRIQWDFKERKD